MAHSVATPTEAPHTFRLRFSTSFSDLVCALLFTITGFLVMGYHPGLEDDGLYLTAIKADLNPALFPRNAEFFRVQLEATQFDRWMAAFIRLTHMPVDWAELFWQLAALFLILFAAKKIANLLFAEEHARWCGVALLSGLFTLPVSGTALYMVDQHLHPRNLATAMILLAVWRMFKCRYWQVALLLLIAFLLHPLMAAMGISFCVFLGLALCNWPRREWISRGCNSLAAAAPLGWVFEPADPSWRRALNTRRYFSIYKWTWYEWLGALAPIVFFWFLWRWSRRNGDDLLARFSLAVFAYGVFHQALAMLLLGSPALVRAEPFQPMRYLHLFYFLFVLTCGCLLGKYALKRSAWRWVVFFFAVNAGMFAWQRAEFAASQHLELPGRSPSNAWLQAFNWIKGQTPQDAYFVMDAHYLEARGEDYHSFRALAERSSLADAVKDAAVVTMVPELGPAWAEQVEAQENFNRFKINDFERLKSRYGVGWALVRLPLPEGLDCRWHNDSLAVCEIP